MNFRTLDHIDKVQRQILENISKIKQPHNMKYDFKIGDKVRLTGTAKKGKTGEIVLINGCSHSVRIDNTIETLHFVSECEMELLDQPLPSPSAADILAAAKANPCAEGVLKALYPGVFQNAVTKEYSPTKIYVTLHGGTIWKLQMIDYKYRFCDMSSVVGGTCSIFDNAQDAIKHEIKLGLNVAVFSNQREFLEWAMEVTRA